METTPATLEQFGQGKGLESRGPRHRLWVALSLLATPVPLFLSTSATLYLTNQDELHRRVAVLLPFGAYLLGTWLVGCMLYGLSRLRPFAFLLRAYYALGPFFLVYLFFHNLSAGVGSFSSFTESLPGLAIYAGLFLVTLVLLARRFPVASLVKPFGVFSLLLLLIEGISFAGTYRPPELGNESPRVGLPTAESSSLPNIYHIILDGYQSDIFPLTLDERTKKAFEGFTFFREATSLYGLTRESLPTVFSGQDYPPGVPREAFQEAAFAGKESMLYWLKKAGYGVIAFAPKTFPFEPKLYDQRIDPAQNTRRDELLRMDRAAFARLWVFANAPRVFTDWLMGTDWFIRFGGARDLKLIRNGRFLGYSRALASYLAFLNVVEQEKRLSPSGRYTFLHLLIPHPPYVLASDCSHDRPGVETGPLAQAGCATLLAVSFIERLKELGRFDDSIVVIHGDHGDYFDASEGKLSPIEDTSLRVLLLVKPVGRGSSLRVSEADASLLDVAPTVLDAAGVANSLPATGVSLLPLVEKKSAVRAE